MKNIFKGFFFIVSLSSLINPLFSNPLTPPTNHSQNNSLSGGQSSAGATTPSTEETYNTNLDVLLSDNETASAQYFSTCLEDDMLSECGSAAWDGVGRFFGDLASTASSVAKTAAVEGLRASATMMGGAPILNHFGAEDSYTKGMRLAKEAKESIQAIPQSRWDAIKAGVNTVAVETMRLSATIMPLSNLGMKALNIEDSNQKAMRLAYQAAEPMADLWKKWNDPVEGPILRKKIKQVVISLAMNLVGENSSCQEIAKKACSLMGEEAAPTLAVLAVAVVAGAVSVGSGAAATLSANLARLALKFPRLKNAVDKAIAAIKALKHSNLSQKAKSIYNKIGQLAADVKKKYHQKLQSFSPQQREEFQSFIMNQCGAN